MMINLRILLTNFETYQTLLIKVTSLFFYYYVLRVINYRTLEYLSWTHFLHNVLLIDFDWHQYIDNSYFETKTGRYFAIMCIRQWLFVVLIGAVSMIIIRIVKMSNYTTLDNCIEIIGSFICNLEHINFCLCESINEFLSYIFYNLTLLVFCVYFDSRGEILTRLSIFKQNFRLIALLKNWDCSHLILVMKQSLGIFNTIVSYHMRLILQFSPLVFISLNQFNSYSYGGV